MMPPEAAPIFPPPPVSNGSPQQIRSAFGNMARIMAAPLLWGAAFVVPPPATHGGKLLGMPSLCLFYRMTGWPCPGCGLTRSCVCFAHGRWAESFVFHPLGPLFFVALGLMLLLRLPLLGRRLTPRLSRWAAAGAYGAVGLFVAVWVARLLHFLPLPPRL